MPCQDNVKSAALKSAVVMVTCRRYFILEPGKSGGIDGDGGEGGGEGGGGEGGGGEGGGGDGGGGDGGGGDGGGGDGAAMISSGYLQVVEGELCRLICNSVSISERKLSEFRIPCRAGVLSATCQKLTVAI